MYGCFSKTKYTSYMYKLELEIWEHSMLTHPFDSMQNLLYLQTIGGCRYQEIYMEP
jgi:hypothetical protein